MEWESTLIMMQQIKYIIPEPTELVNFCRLKVFSINRFLTLTSCESFDHNGTVFASAIHCMFYFMFWINDLDFIVPKKLDFITTLFTEMSHVHLVKLLLKIELLMKTFKDKIIDSLDDSSSF